MSYVKQLIQVAPFPEEVKTKLLNETDNMAQDQIFEVMESCWSLISAKFQNDLRLKMQKAGLEMAQGRKTYTKEDFQQMEEDMFSELVQQLDAAGDQNKISEIKKLLGISEEKLQNPA